MMIGRMGQHQRRPSQYLFLPSCLRTHASHSAAVGQVDTWSQAI